mgnify:CR=1 FL=1
MSDLPIRYFPLGDAALTVEFGSTISEEMNMKAVALSKAIEDAHFPWVIESAPAYASTTVFDDPLAVKRYFPESEPAFTAVKNAISGLVEGLGEGDPSPDAQSIEIPVDFGSETALDLAFVAENAGLAIPNVIDIFTSIEYRIYMLGFLPGFAYMGEIDERIKTPRRRTPRTSVPKGSVGIADRQTGIYPLRSPGGWQIIGRTDVELFTPFGPELTLLRPGGLVRFVAI